MSGRIKHVAAGLFFIVFGVLIAVGPKYIFKICEQDHGHATNCLWTARAELGIGIVIALLGAAYILSREVPLLAGLSLSLVLNGALAFLIPNILMGMCEHPHMDCRLVTLPSLNVISLTATLAAAANTVRLIRKYRGDARGNATAQAERV
ncbi:MAG: DUF4418 family protein [Synergistaceae bacterium]|jgi:hypothetical protein|nr:DUF4418 family protein [Synergistaceae bacterium]